MSTVPEIKQRLLEPGTPFAWVKGVTALAKTKDRPDGVLPGAFVLTAKEVSAENQRATGPVLQRSERDIMVVIVAEELSDADGDATADVLEDLKTWVRGQLVGFVPTDMDEKITHVGGEVVQTVAACVWFEDTFSAPTYLRQAP